MVNESLLELVNKSLIITVMDSLSLTPGRRARQIVPSLPRAVAAARTAPATGDDLKLFWMTFAGGLVFFGTFFS